MSKDNLLLKNITYICCFENEYDRNEDLKKMQDLRIQDEKLSVEFQYRTKVPLSHTARD